MFDPDSRYDQLAGLTLTVKDSDGVAQTVIYKERRFLPLADSPVVVEHRVAEGDRLDNLTAQYLGDPAQFWRLCDANLVLKPSELTDEIGTVIQIKLPGQ